MPTSTRITGNDPAEGADPGGTRSTKPGNPTGLAASGLVAPIAGHAGDGIFHLGIMYDPDDADETRRAEDLAQRVGERAIRFGGTCTGEHGIGLHKRDLLEREFGNAVDLMRAIKQSFDPTRHHESRQDAERDAAATHIVVSRLKEAGAVILGKTNVPLDVHDWQSYNEIYGTTNNPWDLGGSPGGSLRTPAHFCDVFSHEARPQPDPHARRGTAAPAGECARRQQSRCHRPDGAQRRRSEAWRARTRPPRCASALCPH